MQFIKQSTGGFSDDVDEPVVYINRPRTPTAELILQDYDLDHFAIFLLDVIGYFVQIKPFRREQDREYLLHLLAQGVHLDALTQDDSLILLQNYY